jgi:hypothetical protein
MPYDWRGAYWTDLKTAINAVWPEITQTFKVVNVERLNWQNEIGKKRLVAPWCVVHLPRIERAQGFGAANQTYNPTPTVYYVAEYKEGAVDDLSAKLNLLEDYLMTHGFSFTLEEETLNQDISEENTVKASMLQADMLYVAASLGFSCITGYVLSRAS